MGKVQWAVRDCLVKVTGDDVVLLSDIAAHVFGRPALAAVPRAHIESVRRALATLERLGVVELFYVVAPTSGTGWIIEQYAPEYAAGSRSRRRQLAARLAR